MSAPDERSLHYRPDVTPRTRASLRLVDLIDAATLQSMMDDFHELTRIPMALIDVDGNGIVGAGWQDVCTRFHRVNPDSCAHCVESDTLLTADIPVGTARLYQCKNGMWDAATPIVVGGERVANLFTGQFFFDDEPVDLDLFREQARRYGFDEAEYLAAVQAVSRLGRRDIDVGLRFLTKLSQMISQLGYSNSLREQTESELQDALTRQTSLAEDLDAERGVLQAIMENTATHLAYLDPEFRFVAVNSAYAQGSGHTEAELIGRNHFDLFPNVENQAIFERVRETGEPAEYRAKPFVFEDQPWRGITYWDWRLNAVKDAEGRLQGFAFSLQDVTLSVRQKAYSDALNRLNDVVHSTLDFDTVLAQFVPQLAEAAGCEVVTVGLRSEDGEWAFREVYGLPEELKARRFRDEELSMAGVALNSDRPTVVLPDDGGHRTALAASLGIRSLLVAPLSVGGQRLGAIAYGFVSGPGEFDDNDLDFAGKIAASLSLALQNALLYEAERAAARMNEALAAIDRSIHGTLEPDEMLRRVVVEAAEALECDSSAMDMRENGDWVVRYVYRFPDDAVGRAFSDAEVPFAALAAESRSPVAIDDAFTDPRVDPEVQRAHNVRSVMVTPLVVKDEVLGVLFFNYHDRPHAFSKEELAFAQRLSASLSLAVANAKLYEAEHRIADRLQEALLALPDEIAGVDFAHSYHSAAEAARVGGDFYDLFELDQDHVAVVMGDVAGKGLDGAALTSLVKNTIRAHAVDRGKTPSQILALTNEVVYRATTPEEFITVFLGVLDCRGGRLTYSNAGHTTAALMDGGCAIERLEATGPLLGGFNDAEFADAEACLERDGLLFLYTDGVTEARRDGELYGEERLLSFLGAAGRLETGDAVREVLADVMSFSGNRLRDDLALLAVRRGV